MSKLSCFGASRTSPVGMRHDGPRMPCAPALLCSARRHVLSPSDGAARKHLLPFYVENGLMPIVISCLQRCVDSEDFAVSCPCAPTTFPVSVAPLQPLPYLNPAPQTATPVIRTLGNIVCGPDDLTETVRLPEHPWAIGAIFTRVMNACLRPSDCFLSFHRRALTAAASALQAIEAGALNLLARFMISPRR